MIEIACPTTEAQLQNVRNLFRSFQEWLRVRYADMIHLVDDYFDKDAFEAELRRLPGEYEPTLGNLLVAEYEG